MSPHRPEPTKMWPIIVVLGFIGCMTVEQVAPPQKQPVGLAATIKENLVSRHQAIVDLALARLKDEQDKKLSPDDIKAAWNTGYHGILGNSVNDLQSAVKEAMDAAKSPEERIAVWQALAKGFAP